MVFYMLLFKIAQLFKMLCCKVGPTLVFTNVIKEDQFFEDIFRNSLIWCASTHWEE